MKVEFTTDEANIVSRALAFYAYAVRQYEIDGFRTQLSSPFAAEGDRHTAERLWHRVEALLGT